MDKGNQSDTNNEDEDNDHQQLAPMSGTVLRGLNMFYPLKFLRIIGVGHISMFLAEKNKNLENQVVFSGSS